MTDAGRFVILGGGNGGQSLAADLSERGFHVAALYDRFPEMIEAAKNRGGVEMLGPVRSGFGQLDLVTSDIGEAISAGDILVVAVPAFAHDWIAEHAAPHLRDGQTIVLMPGYIGGTLLFQRILREKGVTAELTIAETMTFPYATRIVGPAQVGIKGIKNSFLVAALPASKTTHVLDLLKPALPALEPADNVLVTGMNNNNPVSHVPTYLLNVGRIEADSPQEHFDWHSWATLGVNRVQEAIELERRLLAEALGVRFFSRDEIEQMHYGGEPWKIVERTGEIPTSSLSVPPRYIDEDVPMGLVPLASLGAMLGVNTPTIDSLITLASAVKGINFWKEGRTMDRLGLANLTPEQIRKRANS